MPKKSLPTTFPSVWSFPLCLLPVIISTYFANPPPFPRRLARQKQYLPTPRPVSLLCIRTHRQVCTGVSMGLGGAGIIQGDAGTHRVLSQGVAANLALGAPSEPSTPFSTVVFNHFMLVMSFSCSSELAHGGQNVHPPT